MIAQLRGTLGDKRPNQVLVDVGGVGYLVHIPLSTFYALGDLHSSVTLLIHTQVREDAISLYGFFLEVDSQDRFWQNDTAGYRLQIVHAISKVLPIHPLPYLPFSEMYSKTARRL